MADDPRDGGSSRTGVVTPPPSPATGVRPDPGRAVRPPSGEAVGTIRFAVLCDGAGLRAWHLWCLEKLREVEGVEVGLVLTGAARAGDAGEEASASPLWRLYHRRRVEPASEALAKVDPDGLADPPPMLGPAATRGAYGERRLTGRATAHLRDAEPDVVLHLGSGPPPRGSGASARRGVWSFAFGSPEERSDPPGFRQILRGEDVVEATLLREGGGRPGGVLHGGRIRVVDDSYPQTLDSLLRACAAWPARTCREMLRSRLPAARRGREEPPVVPDTRSTPSTAETLGFFLRVGWNYVRNILQWQVRQDDWNVGVSEAEDALDRIVDEGRVPDVTWAPAGSGPRFLADPFGAEVDGELAVLAERYDHLEGKGELCVLDAEDGGGRGGGTSLPAWGEARTVLEVPVHTSYPYLFRFEDDVYCVPETFQAREVRLHRARRFPDEWEEVGVLIEDFAAVDPTIFHHGGRWWLFSTDAEVCSHTVLHAWYADHPFGPWRPHALNPVKTDVASSRPGGTPFRHRGRLYRPAQDCSTRYGAGIALNRIRRLGPAEFEETTVRRVTPDEDGPYPLGLHTMSLADRHVLVDGYRERFMPEIFLKRVKAQLGL